MSAENLYTIGVSLTNAPNSTGATGFIGGDFLAAISRAHPQYSIRALVRGESSAIRIKEGFPTVQPVLGDLDDAEMLRKEAFEADIVISTWQSLRFHVGII